MRLSYSVLDGVPVSAHSRFMNDTNRERRSGRYKFTLDRACTCGHTLGHHTAARVKTPAGSVQECLEDCACECFKPAKEVK
jgi:hypothetical protein